MPTLRLEGHNGADRRKRQRLGATCPVAPRRVDRDQADYTARRKTRLADSVDTPGEGAPGVGGLVDDHGHGPLLGAAREPRHLPLRDTLLRTDGHRVRLLVAVGFEVGAKQRGEV